MNLKVLRASWNPRQYVILRELPLKALCIAIMLATLASAATFSLLLLPTIAQSASIMEKVSRTTDISITASLTQSEPAYVLRNPDIVITTSSADAFITITPDYLSIKRFIFFGEKTYSWEPLAELDTAPVRSLLLPLAIFLIPSIITWLLLTVTAGILLAALLFVLVAGITLHLQNVLVRTVDLLKVALLASVPSLTVLAVTPILRFGLPLPIIAGLIFALWLTLASLGISSIIERGQSKYSSKRS